MKNFFTPVLLLLVLSGSISAQTVSPAEKKIYKSEDDKLYINKDLGLYLWLSTSPDPDSKKVRLESDSSSHYANPMFLDTEGYNTVRSPFAVDTTTKQMVYPPSDIIFEVYADGIPPVSRSSFSYGGTRTLNGKRYYGGEVKIELSSQDQTSGIESLNFSFNSTDFVPYKEALRNVKEGENILRYYSIDRVGNQEEIHEEVFYHDPNPPKTSYEILGDQNEKYISADAKIQLTSSDELSGVKTIFYRINTGKFIPYTTPIPAKLLAGENSSISFYAEDLLGNKESVQTIGSSQGLEIEGRNEGEGSVVFEFYVDREAPEVKLDFSGDQYAGKYVYVSDRTQFKIMAEDAKSGVNKIHYSINSSSLSEEYKGPFSLRETGLNYLNISAVDYVGNASAILVKPFFCDTDNPASSLQIGSPKFVSRDTLFISSQTKISLSASDSHSGVQSIKYRMGEEDPQNYTGPFVIDRSGLLHIYYSASDQVGNQEEEKHQLVYLDNDPPKIHYHFSVESIGNKVIREENYTIYPTNAMLYIAATDSRSGGEKINYSINEGGLLSANPIKGLAPGNYLIRVFAYDVLGNKSTEEIKFAIEK